MVDRHLERRESVKMTATEKEQFIELIKRMEEVTGISNLTQRQALRKMMEITDGKLDELMSGENPLYLTRTENHSMMAMA